MPVYDMLCEGCDHKWDVVQPMSEALPTTCPECGKKKVRRAWSQPPAFIDTYSPLHPRRGRGKGSHYNRGYFKSKR